MDSHRSRVWATILLAILFNARTSQAQLLPPFPDFPNYFLCEGAFGRQYTLTTAQVQAVIETGGYFDQARDRIYALTPGELAELDPSLTGPNGPITYIRNNNPGGYEYIRAELFDAMSACNTDPVTVTLYGGDQFNFYCSNYSSDINDLGGRFLLYQTMRLVFGGLSTFAVQPQDLAVCPSGSAMFFAVALPNGPSSFDYHWQVRRRPAPGAIGLWQDITNGENAIGVEFLFNAAAADTGTLTLDRSTVPQGSGAQAGWFAIGSPPLQFRCRFANYCGSDISRIATLTTCPADFDCSGGLSVQDIFAFLNAWFAGDPRADFNGGGLDVQDIFDFLNAWFAGCP